MTPRAGIFWVMFTGAGVWLQFFLPGVDVLVPGLLVSMQREKAGATFWLAAVWVLLQEGMGNLPFGGLALYYVIVATAFWIGCRAFECDNFPFICLFGLVAAAARFLILAGVGGLADIELPLYAMLGEGLKQAVVFPLVWLAGGKLHSRFVPAHAAYL